MSRPNASRSGWSVWCALPATLNAGAANSRISWLLRPHRLAKGSISLLSRKPWDAAVWKNPGSLRGITRRSPSVNTHTSWTPPPTLNLIRSTVCIWPAKAIGCWRRNSRRSYGGLHSRRQLQYCIKSGCFFTCKKHPLAALWAAIHPKNALHRIRRSALISR